MRILILGAGGALGSTIGRHLERETDWNVARVTRTTLTENGIEHAFNASTRADWTTLFSNPQTRPDTVINAAAMTNVDACESNRKHAWTDNVDLVIRANDACRAYHVPLIHFSTDYIFDGKHGPYAENGIPNPINYYGKTKLAAENECRRHGNDVTIVRTMWLYGGSSIRPSYIEWLTTELTAGRTIRIAHDEIGSPTLCEDVAAGIRHIIEIGAKGLVNLAGPEIISRLDIAYIVANWVGADPELIIPVLSRDLNRPAARPLQSGLLTLRAQALLHWHATPLVQGLIWLRTVRNREAIAKR